MKIEFKNGNNIELNCDNINDIHRGNCHYIDLTEKDTMDKYKLYNGDCLEVINDIHRGNCHYIEVL